MAGLKKTTHHINRRRFIKVSTLGAGSLLVAPQYINAKNAPPSEELRFAIISDVHIRYRPVENGGCSDAVTTPEDRHDLFLKDAEAWNSDVIINLGDVQARNFDEGAGKQFHDAWNAWPREKICVRGNHDDDFMSVDEYVDKMGMPGRYYSRTIKGWTFIVLDSGDPAIAPGSEGETWGEEQVPWFEEQLRNAPGRCIILVHHGRDRNGPRDLPPQRIKHIIDKANEEADYQKVVAYIWGHVHQTLGNNDNGVHYVLINSSSYRWGGSGVGPIFYNDPPPYAMGHLTATGSLTLNGTGIPDNWALNYCEVDDLHNRTNDDMTYQISIPTR